MTFHFYCFQKKYCAFLVKRHLGLPEYSSSSNKYFHIYTFEIRNHIRYVLFFVFIEQIMNAVRIYFIADFIFDFFIFKLEMVFVRIIANSSFQMLPNPTGTRILSIKQKEKIHASWIWIFELNFHICFNGLQ